MASDQQTQTPIADVKPDQPSAINTRLQKLGEPVIVGLTYIGGLNQLMWQTVVWAWRSAVLRQVRFGRAGMYTQIVRVGVRSVAVIGLVSGAIGVILALQMAAPLDTYGSADRVATIVALTVVRELGPLITAIVLTGFAGASIAAEMGTMVVGEEIEALQAHALNPVRFLVLPRMIAATLSTVALCVFAELVAIGGGYLIGIYALDIPSGIYYANTVEALDLGDFFTGFFKAGVFGAVIGSIACYNGLNVTGGAAGVGRATTNTVVHSIVLIIMADLLFTAIFYRFGWT